jgi:hypothetical protein
MIYQLAFGGKAVDVRTIGANMYLRHSPFIYGSGFLNIFLSLKIKERKANI